MSDLADLGEISKGAWSNSYGSYGQDDQRSYKGGRYLGAAGAGTAAASTAYGLRAMNQSLSDKETRKGTQTAVRNLNRTNDLQQFKTEMPRKYVPKLKRARTGAKIGGAALLAAPLVGAANVGRKKYNSMTSGQLGL